MQATRYVEVDKHPVEFDYLLVEDDTKIGKIYGVEVITKLCNGDTQLKSESELVEGLSCKKSEVVQMIDQLIAYTVTPVTLVEVLDEMVGGCC